MAPMPEPHYFGSDLNHWWMPQYTEEQYLQLFSAAGNRKVIGEKSALYLVSERAAAEIKIFSPEGKIIAMLRNPVEMLYSLHSQAIRAGREIDNIVSYLF